MDRSLEFFSTVEVLQRSEGGGSRPRPHIPEKSQVLEHSKRVAAALRSTLKLVTQIDRLAQKKSLFDDPSGEINRLSAAVRATMNEQKERLQELVSLTQRGPYSRGQTHQMWLHVAEVLQGHWMANNLQFQAALKVAAANEKDRQSRQKTYSHSNWAPVVQRDTPLFGKKPGASVSVASPPLAPPVSAPAAAVSTVPPVALPSPDVGPSGGYGMGVRRRAGAGDKQQPVQPSGSTTLLMQYNTHRDDKSQAQQYESQILELGQMFHEMSTIVAESEAKIIRIDADVTAAEGHIKAGQMELFQYFRSVSENRAFIFKVFGVLVFIILLVAIFRRHQ